MKCSKFISADASQLRIDQTFKSKLWPVKPATLTSLSTEPVSDIRLLKLKKAVYFRSSWENVLFTLYGSTTVWIKGENVFY